MIMIKTKVAFINLNATFIIPKIFSLKLLQKNKKYSKILIIKNNT